MTATSTPIVTKKDSIQTVLRDLLFMFMGVAAYTFGWTAFILSQDVTSGGLAGITTIIQIATNIPATIPYNIINVGLLVLSLIFLGWKFSLKTVLGVGMLAFTIPVGQALFTPTDTAQGLQIYQNLPDFVTSTIPHVGPMLTNEPFVALFIGSIFCGIGLGFVFSVNGSTGGTDVVVAIINKYRNISLGRAMIMVDTVIIVTGCIVSHYFGPQYSWSVAIGKLAFSVVEILVVAQTLDFYMNSNRQSVQFLIFSLKYEEINEAITKRLQRGCTILEAQGGYSRQPAKVLMVVARKNMSVPIHRIVREIDPKAFVSEARVRGVYGEGFDALNK
ncbi:MAG: YitT family protein [Porphyromonas sp.]|nr:YitT family protein [Porphyromonas sp.]